MTTTLRKAPRDTLASAGNLLAVRQALTPADRQHRFGHGKAEPIAGLVQGLFIAGSTGFLVYEGIARLLAPRPTAYGALSLAVMLFSVGLTFALVAYQRRVVRRTGSLAISADRLHYAGDPLTNLGIIVALILSTSLGWQMADPVIGVAVAVVLGLTAWQVLRQSYDQLMDRELGDDERRRIRSVVLADPRVRGLHDLRTRAAGTTRFIQLHIEMDPAMNLGDAHRASDQIEQQLLQLFPGADILIHLDPHGVEQPPSALARS